MDTTPSPTTTQWLSPKPLLFYTHTHTETHIHTHTHTHTHTHSYHFDAPVLQFPIPLRDKPPPTYTGL